MLVDFNEKELIDIVRWAEHERCVASFQTNVDRAKRIKAKVSQALAATPSALPETGATPAEKTAQTS